ncbi:MULTISPECIES: glycosyltransferase family 4 protein [Bacteria]|uniref:glycosyltransferase family 4 protein n=1 Tax=Bacteria TaxID=2 RepID=UPI003C7A40B6
MSAPEGRRVLVLLEDRFEIDAEGRLHTANAALAGERWRADLPAEAEAAIVARARVVAEPTGMPVTGRFVALPYGVGLRQTLAATFRTWRVIGREMRSASLAVVKVPGLIGLLAGISARRRGVPLAAQVVGDAGGVLRSGVVGRLARLLTPVVVGLTRGTVRRASAVRYVTRSQLQSRYPAAPGATTHAFSDVVVAERPVWRLREDEAPAIVTVGSADQLYKGHDLLIASFPAVLSAFPGATLTIVGSGRYLDHLRELAHRAGVADAVRFPGYVSRRDELEAVVGAATLFVLPSLTEGMPRALIEAMALGTPAIASRVGGVPELLPADATFEPGDVPAMTALVLETLRSPDRMRELSWKGREATRAYGAEARAVAQGEWAARLRELALGPGGASSSGEEGSSPGEGSGARRVLHVLGSLDRGGAETVALDLCRAVPAEEFAQTFYCLSGREGVLAGEFRAAGAEVLVAAPGGMLARLRDLRRVVRAQRPHVVVSHVSLASAAVLGAIRGLGVRVRVARGHSAGDGRGPIRAVYRTTSRVALPIVATDVLGVSEAALSFLVGRQALLYRMFRTDRRVLGNGVDTSRFHPAARAGAGRRGGRARVLHVGRASPEKNRTVLVPVFEALVARRDAEMRVVGPGGVDDLGPLPEDPRFTVTGPSSEVPAILRESDALLLPSLREGLPGVVLEALASGVPVVASALPTLEELADLPGVILVDPRADAGHWAEAVERALDVDGPARSRIAATLRESRFVLERSVDEWVEVWGR